MPGAALPLPPEVAQAVGTAGSAAAAAAVAVAAAAAAVAPETDTCFVLLPAVRQEGRGRHQGTALLPLCILPSAVLAAKHWMHWRHWRHCGRRCGCAGTVVLWFTTVSEAGAKFTSAGARPVSSPAAPAPAPVPSFP
jgi:hypothetical protein